LGEKEAFPVIIASHLKEQQEEDLLAVLRKNREAIDWTMADIKGISPSIVQYRIHLKEKAKPKRDPHRRLNPIMQEVVRTEIVKLLDNGIIYPISDSQWVSPVHAVPKKAGFTMVENDKKELVQTRLSTKIRVRIDYRKLNTATYKDHFPLPFIDQMLERFAGHEYNYFLDGYSGYNQIQLLSRTKKTQLSPVHLEHLHIDECPLVYATLLQCSNITFFSDMVERFLEIFMDDFSIYGDSFE